MIRRYLARRRADRAALAAMTPVQRRIVRAYRIPPRLARHATVGTTGPNGEARWFGPLADLAVCYPTPKRGHQ